MRQDSTFSAVLERYLNNNKIRAEVINAGVSRFGTAEELVFLEEEGFKYHPDVVVLGFFANDFEDNLKAGLFELDGQGCLVKLKHQHIPGVRIQKLHLRDSVGKVVERELVRLLAAVQRHVELL